jgi:hypothetical protein
MEKKNINPETIEAGCGEKEKQQEITVNKFDEKNYLNVKLDIKNKELSKEIKIRISCLFNARDERAGEGVQVCRGGGGSDEDEDLYPR